MQLQNRSFGDPFDQLRCSEALCLDRDEGLSRVDTVSETRQTNLRGAALNKAHIQTALMNTKSPQC